MGRSLFVALLLTGLGGEQPDGRLVLGVAGQGPERVVVADPRTGLLRRRRLAGGTLCHGPVLAIGDRVVFGGDRGRRAVALSLPLALRGRARSLGPADTFTPSAAPGRLWLGDWGRPSRRWSSRPVPVELREVDATGRVTARATSRMPRYAALHAAVSEGFVGTEGRWLTLRRGQRRVLRVRDGWFAAAGRSHFAWCRGKCTRLVVRGPDGVRTIAAPRGARLLGSGAAFSPDERRLATPITLHGRTRIAVADLASGAWTLVPGGGEAVAWSPSGRWLYIRAGERRLRAWRLGAERALALAVRPGGRVLSIATSADFSGP